MTPVILYHATGKSRRMSIFQDGLIPNKPTKVQPYAVYAFDIQHEWSHGTRDTAIEWTHAGVSALVPGNVVLPERYRESQDLWQVTYVGPIKPDIFVTNGLALLCPVQPEHVQLVLT